MNGKFMPHERPAEGYKSEAELSQYQLESGDQPDGDSEPIVDTVIIEAPLLNEPAEPALAPSLKAMRRISEILGIRR